MDSAAQAASRFAAQYPGFLEAVDSAMGSLIRKFGMEKNERVALNRPAVVQPSSSDLVSKEFIALLSGAGITSARDPVVSNPSTPPSTPILTYTPAQLSVLLLMADSMVELPEADSRTPPPHSVCLSNGWRFRVSLPQTVTLGSAIYDLIPRSIDGTHHQEKRSSFSLDEAATLPQSSHSISRFPRSCLDQSVWGKFACLPGALRPPCTAVYRSPVPTVGATLPAAIVLAPASVPLGPLFTAICSVETTMSSNCDAYAISECPLYVPLLDPDIVPSEEGFSALTRALETCNRVVVVLDGFGRALQDPLLLFSLASMTLRCQSMSQNNRQTPVTLDVELTWLPSPDCADSSMPMSPAGGLASPTSPLCESHETIGALGFETEERLFELHKVLQHFSWPAATSHAGPSEWSRAFLADRLLSLFPRVTNEAELFRSFSLLAAVSLRAALLNHAVVSAIINALGAPVPPGTSSDPGIPLLPGAEPSAAAATSLQARLLRCLTKFGSGGTLQSLKGFTYRRCSLAEHALRASLRFPKQSKLLAILSVIKSIDISELELGRIQDIAAVEALRRYPAVLAHLE